MYPFVESIRAENGKIQNLSYHQQRLDRTYAHIYGVSSPFRLAQLIKYPDDLNNEKVKLRFLYGKRSYRYEIETYKPKHIKTLQIVFDNKINYSFKKTRRNDIKRLLARKNDCDDILIVKNGYITDTSTANICFFNGKSWLTPDTPLLEGTCRARLLKEGRIQEACITLEHIPFFESFCLINAMIEGFDDPLPISSIIHNS